MLDALAAALPRVAAAPGGTPATDWRTLQLSCATFLFLWLANQALWRRLRWHTGKVDALCVRAARRARAPARPWGHVVSHALSPTWGLGTLSFAAAAARTPCPAA
jgi:hypothetical protein